MKLHGHARLELADVHTGEVEVVESDNLITNAVSDIFNGYGGSLNKAMLLWRGDTGYTDAPKDLVSMFYGGLLLYDTALQCRQHHQKHDPRQCQPDRDEHRPGGRRGELRL